MVSLFQPHPPSHAMGKGGGPTRLGKAYHPTALCSRTYGLWYIVRHCPRLRIHASGGDISKGEVIPTLYITCHSFREGCSSFGDAPPLCMWVCGGWGPGSHLGGCGQVQGRNIGSRHSQSDFYAGDPLILEGFCGKGTIQCLSPSPSVFKCSSDEALPGPNIQCGRFTQWIIRYFVVEVSIRMG